METIDLSDDIRTKLLELANAMAYDGGAGEVEVYEPVDEYDPSGAFGMVLKTPLGPTFSIVLTNGRSSDTEVRLFDGTALPNGVTEVPEGRNAQITTWARGGNPLAIRSFRVSAADQVTRDGLIFTIGKTTPFGGELSNQVAPLEFITEKDYSQTIASVPASFVIDGFTYLRFVVPASQSIALSFFIGGMKDGAAALRGIKPALPVKDGVIKLTPVLPRRQPGLGLPAGSSRPTGGK